MEAGDRVDDLPEEDAKPGQRHRLSALAESVEGPVRAVFHDNVERCGSFVEIVKSDDVGVADFPEDLGFAVEHRAHVGFLRWVLENDLHAELAVVFPREDAGGRAVATFAENFEDLVIVKGLAHVDSVSGQKVEGRLRWRGMLGLQRRDCAG